MKLNPAFRLQAFRAYRDQLRQRFKQRSDQCDRYVALGEWDVVRLALIDMSATAKQLNDVENKLADLE